MHDLSGGKAPSDVLRYLDGVTFPARKDEIVLAARRNGAPNDIVAALEVLPRSDIASQDELIELYPHLDDEIVQGGGSRGRQAPEETLASRENPGGAGGHQPSRWKEAK